MSDPHAKPHIHESPPLHDPVDPWHDHSQDEKPQHAHAEVGNAFGIMGIGIGLFMVIVVAVIATYGFYVHQTTKSLAAMEVVEYGTRGAPTIEARITKGEALMQLEAPASLINVPAQGETPARTMYRIPINLAKEATARDYLRLRN